MAKKQEFLDDLKSKISALQLPFVIDIYSENSFYNFLDYHYAILCFPSKNILPKFENLEFILTTNVGYDDFIDETKNFKIPIGRLIYPPAI